MKRVAKCLFVLCLATLVTPVVVGLVGHNTALPISLIVLSLLITGVIIQTRSDPAYALKSVNRE